MEDNMNKRPRPRRNVERIGRENENRISQTSASEGSAMDNENVPSNKSAENAPHVLPKSSSQLEELVPKQRPRPAKRVAPQKPQRPHSEPFKSEVKPDLDMFLSIQEVQAKAEEEKLHRQSEEKIHENDVKVAAPSSQNAADEGKAGATSQFGMPMDEGDRTKLTDVQPNAKFKTPIRKKKEDKASAGTLRGILKALIYITVVLAVSGLLSYIIIIVGNDVFAFVKSDEIVVVTIPEDATVDDIADILGKNKIIKFPMLFKMYASISGEDGVDDNGNSVFIPGEYQVSPMNNYMQLLAAFQKQYTRDTVWVTFPEGTSVEEMINILVDEYGIASREEFLYAINEYDYEFEFLDGIDELDGRYYRLEGYLFPDTYQFYTDSSAETVIYKMLSNFDTKLGYVTAGKLDERLAELGMTLDEVVTLASIVEEEVKYPIDYDQVSSVFYNRLANSSRFPKLESDATTLYAIQMETGKRPATIEAYELGFESPYNTRYAGGLTPGAITNPGYEALYCAFYPAETNYYYFVADINGYNLYSSTLGGHEANKASVRRQAEN